MKASTIANFILALLMAAVCVGALLAYCLAVSRDSALIRHAVGGWLWVCFIGFALVVAVVFACVILRIDYDKMTENWHDGY